MRLRIQRVRDRGSVAKERLVIKVLADTDVGSFAIFRTHFTQGEPTVAIDDTFWFPDSPVVKGDFVVVYTKNGSLGTKQLASGATTHFFYWGSTVSLWEAKDMGAVLLEVNEWQAFQPT